MEVAVDNVTDDYSYVYAEQDVYAQFLELWDESSLGVTNKVLQVYFVPVFIILGSIGNILLYALTSQRLANKFSVFVYVRVYAVLCTLALCLLSSEEWLYEVSSVRNIERQSDWLCRLHRFIDQLVRRAPAGMVVFMVADRAVFIYSATRAKSLCTVFTAKVLSICSVLFCVAVTVHLLWLHELRGSDTGDTFCSETEHRYLYEHIWMKVVNVALLYAPVVLVMTSVVAIAARVTHMAWCRQSVGGDAQWQLVATATSVGVVFLTLQLPSAVFGIIQSVVIIDSIHKQITIFFIFHFAQFLQSFLWSINLPLFLVTSPLLRHELRRQVCDRCCGRAVGQSTNRCAAVSNIEEAITEKDGLMPKRGNRERTQEVTQC